MSPLSVLTLSRGKADISASSHGKLAHKNFVGVLQLAWAIICLLWIVTPSMAQQPSTRTITAPRGNAQQPKHPVDILLRARRGELPYGKIFKNILPSANAKKRLPPLAEGEAANRPGITPQTKPLRIGTVRLVEPAVNPWILGDKHLLSDGRISVMAVATTDSLLMRLHFTKFDLPVGSRVFVYSAENADDVYGPYESKGPLENGEFWTPPIQGDEVVIEYFSSEDAAEVNPPFLINEVAHIFLDPLKSISATVGSCHNDIPAEWSATAKAVGRVDFISGSDELVCTGTLLSNQSNDFSPFFLTAEHCGINNSNAHTVRVWWFYDGAGQTLSSKPHSDAAKWLTSKDRISGTDFTLLQILGSLPTGAVWAGWTTSMPGLFNAVVGIHHPGGSYKRISYGDIGTSIFCPSNEITCGNFLPVDWDNIGGGTTEGGSSGSGLWRDDSSSPQLIGQLYGGEASCTNTSNDYYGRFDLTYNQISLYMDGTWNGSDDNLEQNDSRSNARALAANSSFGNLVVKYADEDWYRISVPSSATISFTTNFEHDYGDIELELYRGSDSTPITTSTSTGDSETVQNTNTGSTSDYFLRVHLFRGVTYSSTRNTYNLGVSVQSVTSITVGQGAPNPQLFITAYNRNGFSQFAKLPPINTVHRWNCTTCDPNNPSWGKGLIQDFNDVTPGVHDALMMADTNTNFVAQIYGGMWDKFTQLGSLEYSGATARMLGYPVADRNCSDFNASCFTDAQLVSPAPFNTFYHYQRFQGGALVQHRSGSRGGQTFEVHGPIRARWQILGGPDGSYGLPISDEYISGGKRRSDFEGGSICYNPTTNQTEDGCASTCSSPVTFALAAPTNGQSLSSATSITLTWGISTNANSYDVYFGTSSNPPFIGNQTETNRTVTVTPGQTYFWKVVAKVNCSSATTTAGVWSFTIQQTCNSPGTFSLNSPSDGQNLSSTTSVNLTWGNSANANSYDVYFGTSSNPPFIGNQTGTSRTVTVTPGQTYFWKVVAKVGCSSATTTAGVRSFSVQQSGCTYRLSSTDNTVGPGTGSTNFNMDTTSGCSWSAVSDSPSWLTTSSSGTGDGQIRYDFVSNNSTSSRTGHITAGGQVHTVTQIGLGGGGNVRLSSSAYSVNENGGTVTITVTRSGGTHTGTIQYSTSNGTATAGSDYTETSGLLLFGSNEMSKSFTVAVLDDSSIEGNESVNVTLHSPSSSFTLGSPSSAILTILDNDTLSAPTANPASNVTSNTFIANWSSSSGAAGYRLDVSTNSSFTSFVSGYQNLDVGNVLNHTIRGLTASTSYHYRVRAYSAASTTANSNTMPVSTVGPIIFIEQGADNQAAAIDSVMWLRGPFRVLNFFNFSADRHTRVILFTSDLGLTQPDSSQLIVHAGGTMLTVENVGPVVGVSGMSASYIVVRLPDGLPTGNLPLVVTLRGLQSVNSPSLGISP
jgi:hypothetical protein